MPRILGIFNKKWVREYDDTKFDSIDLTQFVRTSSRYLLGYLAMYFGILLEIAAFGSDIYTAIVLLAFDRWSSTIEPYVPFHISRWIFGGCIILSVVLFIYDFMVAYTIMKSRNISLNYTNPIARNIYSIRGYRYFCLFAKVTKSRSKMEYLALFVFFTFKGWLRLLLAESPRQVLNALTLYSVLQIQGNFVKTIKALYQSSVVEAVVIGFMTFSLLIWVINILQFAFAIICAVPIYLHLDKEDIGLEEYCCVRVNRRIAKLVDKNHKKGMQALIEENKRLPKQPSLPVLDVNTLNTDYRKPSFAYSGSTKVDEKWSTNYDGSKSMDQLTLTPSNASSKLYNPYNNASSDSLTRSGYGFSDKTNQEDIPLLPQRSVSNSYQVHDYATRPLEKFPNSSKESVVFNNTFNSNPGPYATDKNSSSGMQTAPRNFATPNNAGNTAQPSLTNSTMEIDSVNPFEPSYGRPEVGEQARRPSGPYVNNARSAPTKVLHGAQQTERLVFPEPRLPEEVPLPNSMKFPEPANHSNVSQPLRFPEPMGPRRVSSQTPANNINSNRRPSGPPKNDIQDPLSGLQPMNPYSAARGPDQYRRPSAPQSDNVRRPSGPMAGPQRRPVPYTQETQPGKYVNEETESSFGLIQNSTERQKTRALASVGNFTTYDHGSRDIYQPKPMMRSQTQPTQDPRESSVEGSKFNIIRSHTQPQPVHVSNAASIVHGPPTSVKPREPTLPNISFDDESFQQPSTEPQKAVAPRQPTLPNITLDDL